MSAVAEPGAAPDVTDAAAAQAAAASAAAGVEVREATTDAELRELIAVGEAVWGPGGTFSSNEMRAFEHAGAVVLGAWAPQGPAVGFLVGFLGWRGGLHVHSHQTGVRPGLQRAGVGYALKLAQRAVCLQHGVDDVRWTFDPMVRRNAAFNLERLGARPRHFLRDFYGQMSDAINSSDVSDRFEAVWTLTDPLPGSPDARPRGPLAAVHAVHTVLVDAGGWPRVVEQAPVPGSHVAVPGDYDALRRADPTRARAWRMAVRSVLEQAYGAGLQVVAVDGQGYLLGEDERG